MVKVFLKEPWRVFVLLIFLAGCFGFLRHRQELLNLSAEPLFSVPTGIGLGAEQVKATKYSPALQSLLDGEENTTSALGYSQYLQRGGLLPENHRETVEKLAPQNAWFDLWEISQRCDKAFAELPSVDDEDWSNRFEVIDAAEINELIRLFHEAMAKEHFDPYQRELEAALLAELSYPTNFLENIQYVGNVASVMREIGMSQSLRDFTAAAFQKTVTEDDLEGFLLLERNASKLSHQLYDSSSDLLSSVIFYGWMSSLADEITAAAEHFEDNDIFVRYDTIRQRIEASADDREDEERAEVIDSNTRLMEEHGSMLSMLSSGFSRIDPAPSKLTKADLLPTCRVDHAFFTRALVARVFLILSALAVVAWIVSLRTHPEKKAQTDLQLEKLGTRPYWILIFLGVTLPFLGFLLVRYGTPLGQLDRSVYSSKFVHLALPLGAIVILILCCSSVVALWTADRHRQKIKMELFLIGMPLVSLFLAGLYPSVMPGKWVPFVACGLLLASLILLLIFSFRLRLSDEDQRPFIHRLCVPSYFLMAGYFGIWLLALIAEEKAWFARDEHFRPEGIVMTQREARSAERIHEEVGKFLP